MSGTCAMEPHLACTSPSKNDTPWFIDFYYRGYPAKRALSAMIGSYLPFWYDTLVMTVAVDFHQYRHVSLQLKSWNHLFWPQLLLFQSFHNRTLCANSPVFQIFEGQFTYRKVSNIRRTKSPILNDSRLVLQLSLPNPLKLGIKSRMKM